MEDHRIDSDVLGEVKVPKDAYYGPETQRAIDNFKVSGVRVPFDIIRSYVLLKKAAAAANKKDGKLDAKKAQAISRACDEILNHRFDSQFNLDIFQAGAGTCTNMNVNEVIANLAIEHLGGKKGDYRTVNPNDHVNMSQSTNDTMPCVAHITTYLTIREDLLPQLMKLESALEKKAAEFKRIVKIGRTHLQDAVPLTLGEEFSGYQYAIATSISILQAAQERLLDIPLGGTAVGTGINADEKYSAYAITELNSLTGAKFRLPKNRFALMQQRLELLAAADALKETATAINKIANDLRLLGSGPRAGIGEITLPEILPGSSIMPGKINPSVPEMTNMVCQRVIGSCTTVTEAASGGQLEINVFTPIIAYELLFSTKILSNAAGILAEKCVKGIKANPERIASHMEMNLSLATALSPYVGYAKASEIARKAYKEGKSIKQVCLELRIMDKKKLEQILDPRSQSR